MDQLSRLIVELRAQQPDGNRVVGTAAVFGSYAKIRGGALETIEQRAFDRALSEKHDVVLLVDHNPSLLLARTSNQTLELRTDEHGLHIEAELPATTYANDLKALLARGDVRSMSFGFVAKKDKWTQVQGMSLRTVQDLDLYDVSIVTRPAYADTQISLRSLEEAASQPGESLGSQLIRVRHNLRKVF